MKEGSDRIVNSDQPTQRLRYIREVLRLYVRTPTVLGRVRNADRILAGRLYDQGVPLYAIANAFIIGAARRVLHNGFSTPMPPVRSMHYFVPVLREVLDRPPGYREIQLLQEKLASQLASYYPRW